MVTTQTIALAHDGGRTFDAYLARPEHGQAPSIMIFTEMFGIGQHNRDMAEDYARRGFNALIPNLFWRSAFPGELAFEGPGPRRRLGAACRPRRRCRRPRYRHGSAMAPRAAVFER